MHGVTGKEMTCPAEDRGSGSWLSEDFRRQMPKNAIIRFQIAILI